MKKVAIFGIIVLLLVGILAYSGYRTGDGDRASVGEISGNAVSDVRGMKVPVDKELSMFEFEGFAVGKSHIGTFDEWDGYAIIIDNKIVGVEFTIQADSVNTGIKRLDDHLISDDFFDTANYPEIKFTSTEISENEMKGQLVFIGVTKEVTFPIEFDENSLSSEFYLDVTPFNFKYTGINKEVRIALEMSK
jgi:polyisoprenoid-binding protein YceI